MAHIYEKLGMKRIINAADTYTQLGGSLMPEEVITAMAQAAQWYVDIHELHRRVGQRLAELTRNEAALVTGGASAALAIAAAACMAGDHRGRVDQLPDTTGMKNEIVVHRSQRNPYDQAIRLSGARIVEFGYFDGTHLWQLEAALSEKTAAIFYFAGTTFEQNALPLEEVVRVARRYDIPVVVDAAAQLPPVENLWAYSEAGADLVFFSGGKGLKGPQSAGLIVGKERLIRACAAHAAPNHALGRSMKPGKEEIIGLYAAVERFVQQDWDEVNRSWEEIVQTIIDAMSTIPGICATRLFPGRLGQTYPRAKIRWDESLGLSRTQVVKAMLSDDPPVYVGEPADDPKSIYINPLVLPPDDVHIVIRRLRHVFTKNESTEGGHST